jgi:predicted membrane-bound spermidine synthase
LQIFFLFLLFFISGFSALVYEVTWVRLLGLSLGNSGQATACVLASFLGGLALGGFIGGKFSDRIKHAQLLAYGLAETGVAITGLVVTIALRKFPELFASWCHVLPGGGAYVVLQQLLVSATILIIPTTFMGMTLPLLTRYVSDFAVRPKHFFPKLYALNTFGAVVGSLFTAFVGFPNFGIFGATLVAVFLNIAVGAGAIILSTQSKRVLKEEEQGSTPTNDVVPEQITGKQYKYLLVISAMCGFTSLTYEVLWTRFLRTYLTASTYAFTFMVSNFLLGLVLGSLIYMRMKGSDNQAQTFQERFRQLGLVQLSVAVVALIGYVMLPAALILKAFSAAMADPFAGWSIFLPGDLAASCIFMLPLATLIGICFPLLGELAVTGSHSVGRSAGNVYAANTLGCIVGAASSGLLFIPIIGSAYTFNIVILLTLIIGYLSFTPRSQTVTARLIYWLPAAAFVLFLAYVRPEYTEWAYAKVIDDELLRCREDSSSRAFVLQKGDTKALMINNEIISGDQMNFRRYMRLIGELPSLLCKPPVKVLVICFGVGNTSHALEVDPEVESIDICDLSRAVIECEPEFRATDGNVLNSKKVKVIINDGRNFLLRSADLYDVICLEPPPPQDAGIVNLYTQEFYKLAFERLMQQGKVCQWLPLHCIQGGLLKTMVQAGRKEFPYVSFWIPNNSEALMICSKQPLLFDCKAIQARIDAYPEKKACLAEVGVDDACHILATLLLSGRALDAYVGDVPSLTDDRPQLEFFLTDPSNKPKPTEIPYMDLAKEITNANVTPEQLGIKVVNCDPKKLAVEQKAMRLLYEVNVQGLLAKPENVARAKELAEEIVKLLPNNQYAVRNRDSRLWVP